MQTKTTSFDIAGIIPSQMPVIKNMCRRYFKDDKDKVELLFSEVLERIWRSREDFRGNTVPHFQAWCRLIVKYVFMYYYRQKFHRNMKVNRIDNLMFDLESDTFKANPTLEEKPEEIHSEQYTEIILEFIENRYGKTRRDLFERKLIYNQPSKAIEKDLNLPPNRANKLLYNTKKFLLNSKTIDFLNSKDPKNYTRTAYNLPDAGRVPDFSMKSAWV